MRKILLTLVILVGVTCFCQGSKTDADINPELLKINQTEMNKVQEVITRMATTFQSPLNDTQSYNWTFLGEVEDLLLTLDQSVYCAQEIKQIVFDVLYLSNKYPLLLKDENLAANAVIDALLNLYYTNKDCLPVVNFLRFSVYEFASIFTHIDLPPLKEFILSIDIPGDTILGKMVLSVSDLFHTGQCLGVAIAGAAVAAGGVLGWEYLDYKAKAEFIISAVHAGRQTIDECALAFKIFAKILQRSEK